MEESQELSELKVELEKVNRRLDCMERQIQDQAQRKGTGNPFSVWVLVPIVAIVVWGLTMIFK